MIGVVIHLGAPRLLPPHVSTASFARPAGTLAANVAHRSTGIVRISYGWPFGLPSTCAGGPVHRSPKKDEPPFGSAVAATTRSLRLQVYGFTRPSRRLGLRCRTTIRFASGRLPTAWFIPRRYYLPEFARTPPDPLVKRLPPHAAPLARWKAGCALALRRPTEATLAKGFSGVRPETLFAKPWISTRAVRHPLGVGADAGVVGEFGRGVGARR